MVFITYGKLLEQKIIKPFKSHRGQLPKFIDILNYFNFVLNVTFPPETKAPLYCIRIRTRGGIYGQI